MKKYSFLIISFVISFLASNAQINLVRNPGLEKFWHCPNYFNEIKYAYYWTSIGDSLTIIEDTLDIDDISGHIVCAPEYCNSCATWGSNVGIPYGSIYYYHYPHSGNGMAQLIMFANSSALDTGASLASYMRDYLQGRLYKPLLAGQTYCVSFYVVLEHVSAWAINHIGAYLDNGSIDTATWCGWPQTTHIPQVYTNDVITDSLNWTKIEGTFVANGTEKYITIGNFFDSAHTDKIWTNYWNASSVGNDSYTWYLVDDVSVIPLNAAANAGPDRVIYPGITDSVWVGDTTGYLPCYWYKQVMGTTTWVLIDSNIAGFKVYPDSTTNYVMQLEVCGITSYDTVTVEVRSVGLEPVSAGTQVWLTPNPAHDFVIIEGIKNYSVRVIDIVGREVITYTQVAGNLRIPVTNLQKGIYFVELTDEETGCRMVRKLIIDR